MNLDLDLELLNATSALGSQEESSANNEVARAFFCQNFEYLNALERAGLQDSPSVRNVLKCRQLSKLLVSDDGRILFERIDESILFVQAHLYSAGYGGEFEYKRNKNILSALNALKFNKELQRLLSLLKKPVTNRYADEVIRETIGVSENIPVTDAMTRQAVICALLTTLRQSLGSCFATAPSIIVHDENPVALVKDLEEIILTGKLRRTFAGRELSVPMSPSWGKGTLKRPFVYLKSEMAEEHMGQMAPFWECPTLHSTCIELEIFPRESFEATSSKIRESIRDLYSIIPEDAFWTSAADIIKTLLLRKWDVSSKDLKDYQNRPRAFIQSDLMLHVPSSAKNRGDKVASFLLDLRRAERIFCAFADCPLLKSWEFTMASFAEVRLDFCRWNLYVSLGFNHEEEGGIAELVYKIINGVIESTKVEVEEKKREFEGLAAQVYFLEGRMRSASTESEVQWIKIEYQSRKSELDNIQKMVDAAIERSNKMASLYNFLLTQYDTLFFDYFQEVYDADMHDVSAGPFDDSPAGFRLVYKHGRSNPGLWTRITSSTEFIDTLASFFNMTEQQIREMAEVKGLERELTNIISQIVSHIRSERFLESALIRVAKANNIPLPEKPLENMDRIEKKPWVYTSGGSMHALVGAYFRREDPPQESARWVDSETELLAFLLDVLRQRSTIGAEKGYMLMHSPTHAFLLTPLEQDFHYAWGHDIHSYSWIKHSIVEPSLNLISQQMIGSGIINEIGRRISKIVPKPLQSWFESARLEIPPFFLPHEFARYVKELITSGLRQFRFPIITSFKLESIDALLYSALPYTGYNKSYSLVHRCLEEVGKIKPREDLVDQVMKPYTKQQYIAADELLSIVRTAMILHLGEVYSKRDLLREILEFLKKAGSRLHSPLLFADSNWVREHFAFLVNPSTLRLEFWCIDPYGIKGEPISHWKMWLDGSRKDKTWGVFSNKVQYTA